ncbi:MAG: hypothetical protein A3I15_00315 [Chlamydiae bacterium RIFCSPLOWO2_02_FULL_49_12]|nr:MAG: hypothetical protein A3I15_00315 [Chlamydiae bacterium RIFCSPLOWO2_02_FULL_49_12]
MNFSGRVDLTLPSKFITTREPPPRNPAIKKCTKPTFRICYSKRGKVEIIERMRILHTESSSGWGGQEIRILTEAEGMRMRGHEIVFAVSQGGGLALQARKKGFIVYEVSFKKRALFKTLLLLLQLMRRHEIQLVNTHSSCDAWMGGCAALLMRKKIIRTRHLSTSIRKGLNSLLLYRLLADYVVTTSSCVIPLICKQAKRKPEHCVCIPTGIDPLLVKANEEEVLRFRASLGVMDEDFLVGTACFVRSWKGIFDFLKAAHSLREEKHLKWIIVGGGYLREYQRVAEEMGLGSAVIFTGHLDAPYAALAAMDLFALLSTANEGISQAALQAAYLKRPLITTPIGGLPEVCKDQQTGMIIPPRAPKEFAKAVLLLKNNSLLREEMGRKGRKLVEERFMRKQMLDNLEEVYAKLYHVELKGK